MHDFVLRISGGEQGVLRVAGLEGALGRAKLAWKMGRTALLALAATYGHGIAMAHPFVDGNKRSAYLAMLVFLVQNGHGIAPLEDDAVEAMVAVAKGDWDVERLTVWLEAQPRAN